MKRLSRRSVLRGAGVSLALPWLEAMQPARAQTQPVKRLICWLFPHGVRPSTWQPRGNGPALDLAGTDLQGLERHKARLTVVRNLERATAPGFHPPAWSTTLTQVDIYRLPGWQTVIQNGISLDQKVAQHLKRTTSVPVPVVNITMEKPINFGREVEGSPHVYGNHVSWEDRTTPVTDLFDPAQVFRLLFAAQGAATVGVDEAARRRARSQTVVDAVMDDLQRLRRRGGLGAEDLRRVEEYASRLSELEKRTLDVTRPTCAAPALPASPATRPYIERLAIMHQLITLAFKCDITRVVTLRLGDLYSYIRPTWAGVSAGLHPLSHYADAGAALAQVSRGWATELAKLLDLLAAEREPAGTLLDSSLVLKTSEVAEGRSHVGTNMPVVLAGAAGGAINPGRLIVAPTGTPMANLHVSILQALGLADTRFGTRGTGPLPGLVA